MAIIKQSPFFKVSMISRFIYFIDLKKKKYERYQAYNLVRQMRNVRPGICPSNVQNVTIHCSIRPNLGALMRRQ